MRKSVRLAEIAGGKTAECAAICCCFPFGIASLFFLAAVRLPAGLCGRAVRRLISIRRSKKEPESPESVSRSDGGSGSDSDAWLFERTWPAMSPPAELLELEKELCSRFWGGGFWRSLSQKDVVQ